MQLVFSPTGAGSSTTNLIVTASPQTLTLPPSPPQGCTLLLTNAGTAVVFWAFLPAAASASTSTPLLPNQSMFVDLPGGAIALSVVGSATGSTLYATAGQGR